MSQLELLSRLFSPNAMQRVANAIQVALEQSWTSAPLRAGRTASETKRRIKLAADFASALRMEQGWSIERICDDLPRLLTEYLTTERFDPPKGRIW